MLQNGGSNVGGGFALQEKHGPSHGNDDFLPRGVK
jgi:hypothetical protein